MQDNELKENIVKNIIQYRKACKLTQLELAEKLNYSDKAISKWERGDGIPDVIVLNQMAEIFGVTLNDLTSNSTKVVVPHKKRIKISLKNRTVITLLSFGLVWFIATLVFACINIFAHTPRPWLVFIYTIPISILVVYILSRIWGTAWLNLLFLTLFSWSLTTSVYVTVNIQILWLLFVCTGIFQILILLWFWLKIDKQKKLK